MLSLVARLREERVGMAGTDLRHRLAADELATLSALDASRAVFRGDYGPFHRPKHMQMLLDSLQATGLRPA
jgi:hypothetical protein